MDPDLLFARGRDAADRGNYEYAVDVFRDILRFNPDHLNARIALRGCEVARFQEKGGGLKAKVLGFLSGFGDFVAMHLPGSPDRRAERCENYLEHMPLSTYALKKLAVACRAGGHLDAAVNTLEFVRQRLPDKPAILRMLGEMYAEKEDYARAVRCYEQLARLRPADRQIGDRLRNLSAAEHMHRSRLEEAKSYREQIRDVKKAVELEEEQHIVRTADDADQAIARYQAKLKENPKDLEALLKLGDLYQMKEQFKFAMAAYKQALEVQPRYDVRTRIGDLELRLLKRREAEVAEAAKAHPDDEALQAKAKEAHRAWLEAALKEFKGRLAEHPTEIPLAYNLALLLWEEGSPDSIQEAITLFQRAVEDPRHKLHARFMLGQCFAKDRRTRDMAIDQFQQALEMVTSPTGEMAKAIQYNLGLLHEQAGDRAKALEWYKKVFATDAGYRDVRAKIEQLS